MFSKRRVNLEMKLIRERESPLDTYVKLIRSVVAQWLMHWSQVPEFPCSTSAPAEKLCGSEYSRLASFKGHGTLTGGSCAGR